MHVLDRLRLFRQRGGDGVESHRTALELQDHVFEQPPVQGLEPYLVHLEHSQGDPGQVYRRAAIATHLRVIAHPAQEAVGDARRAPGTTRDLRDGVVVDLDLEDSGRAADDLLELGLGVKVEPVHGPEPVPQRPAQQSLPGGGSHACEVR